MFRAYLKLNTACAACGADFSRSETADVAPYVTVFIIGFAAALYGFARYANQRGALDRAGRSQQDVVS